MKTKQQIEQAAYTFGENNSHYAIAQKAASEGYVAGYTSAVKDCEKDMVKFIDIAESIVTRFDGDQSQQNLVDRANKLLAIYREQKGKEGK